MRDNLRTQRTARAAVNTVAGVTAAALLTVFITAWIGAGTLLTTLPAAVLMLGGIGAFVATYVTWRRAGEWRIWHGAGWALFVLMTIYLAMASAYR